MDFHINFFNSGLTLSRKRSNACCVIKTAVVQIGKTPSAVSGKPCNSTDAQGEPIYEDCEKCACEIKQSFKTKIEDSEEP